MMLQTIYKTARPQDIVNTGHAEDFDNAEYRQVLLRRVGDQLGIGPYIVRVSQGWWDDAGQRPIHASHLFEEEYDSLDQANTSYNNQLQHLVSEGYVHSFSFDPDSDDGRRYEKLVTESSE